MRQLVIDELTKEERDNLDNYMKRTLKQGGMMEGMFWLSIPDDLLAEAQQGHEKCGPFFFALETFTFDVNKGTKKMIIELLVRSQSNLHCSCISYATRAQRDYLLGFVDTMLEAEHTRA